MDQDQNHRRCFDQIWRAIIEVALLLFLFYSIRLMGEFTAANGRGKSLAVALNDVLTQASFVVAIVSALFGVVVVEYLRKKR